MQLTTALFSTLALSLTASSSLLPVDAHKRATDYTGQETQLTFFGYPDNCDSTGCYYSETAYQCSNPDGSSRNGAQGDGSYNNPLSIAFQPGGNFQQCGIIYIAYLQKFGILDGLCASCDTNHLDIWIDSSCSDDASNVCSCEDSLTPSSDQYVYYGITADDPSVFNVDSSALYDSSSQTCTGRVYNQKRGKRDEAGEAQSLVPKSNGLIPRELLRKRQIGACAENSCQCPSC
ncbi:hypothetical protein AOQ84DRAFT_83035 [Glonium stellatum]|uniref:Uncharacterized protein n=1 Tax=Glonium stellatum TaxID=574774 RepID=A0A8E2EWZ3_9PEZI|nr:hypothetical protein AOQ84DRAFT_83035 [Glonium stellatum]